MSEHLHHKLQVLHQALLHGKLPRNLHWSDALDLFQHLGQVHSTDGGEFEFVIGAQREFFKRPHTADLGMEEVSRLRHLLKAAAAETPTIPLNTAGRMVVVIDHHAAHIFKRWDANAALQETTLEPYDPHHFHHHLVHRKEAHYQGDRVPEDPTFYEEVATALAPARDIMLIGHATGKSSAVDFLLAYFKKNHSELARRVVATENADLSALTEPEVEALAKRPMDRRLAESGEPQIRGSPSSGA